MQRYAKNRLCSLDDAFRHSAVWSFWMLERLIKNDLYFKERRRRAVSSAEQDSPSATAAASGAGTPISAPTGPSDALTKRGKKRSASAAELGERPPDQYARLFGRVEPRNIPESSAWWHSRQAELISITEDHELGIMTGMITMTQNDSCPELLAHARRGPCAVPEAAEMCEFLLTRRETGSRRPDIQKDAAASVLSYQRRSRGLKREFLRRHCVTPLGISSDHWDRTEAQSRQALHAHIPWWAKRRRMPDSKDYKEVPEIRRKQPDGEKAAGSSKIGSPNHTGTVVQEDDVYWRAEVPFLPQHGLPQGLLHCFQSISSCARSTPWAGLSRFHRVPQRPLGPPRPPSNAKQSEAKQINAKQSNANQSPAEQRKAKQSSAKERIAKQSKQSNAAQSKTKQSNATQGDAKQCKAKQCKEEQSKAMQSLGSF